jgi:hypothetical protein
MRRKECSAALLALLLGLLVWAAAMDRHRQKPAHRRRLLNWLWTVTWRARNRGRAGALLLSTLKNQPTTVRSSDGSGRYGACCRSPDANTKVLEVEGDHTVQ